METQEQIARDIAQVKEALENLKRGGFGGMSQMEGAIRVIVDDLRDAHGMMSDEDTEELAEEFEENGLADVADHLREHGASETRYWIDGIIAVDDDPEGWRLGNLEIARDRLVTASRQEQGA